MMAHSVNTRPQSLWIRCLLSAGAVLLGFGPYAIGGESTEEAARPRAPRTPAAQASAAPDVPRMLRWSLPQDYKGDPLDTELLIINDYSVEEGELAALAGLGLRRLKRVCMNGDRFTDKALEHVCTLPGIEEAIISPPRTPHGWDILKAMPSLIRLSLLTSSLGFQYSPADIERLRSFDRIRYLYISESRMADGALAALAGMKSLKELNLGIIEPKHTQNMAALKTLTRIERLSLKPHVYSEDRDLEYLQGLNNLVRLGLWACRITDDGLRHLSGLTSLEELDLGRGNSPNEDDPESTQITDRGLSHLADLTQLKVLKLGRTRIAGEGLRHLEKMKDLQELDLSCSWVNDEGLAQVGKLKSLKRLDLQGCRRISEGGIEHLKGLENLQWISLSTTSVGHRGSAPDDSEYEEYKIELVSELRVRQILRSIKGLDIECHDAWGLREFLLHGPKGARPMVQDPDNPRIWREEKPEIP